MYYYEVIVSDRSYIGTKPLSYHSPLKLILGAVIDVELKQKKCKGIVVKQTTKPSFVTKPIKNVLSDPVINRYYVDLLLWMSAYYCTGIGGVTQLLLPTILGEKRNFAVSSTSKIDDNPTTLPALTLEQQNALATIRRSKTSHFLLHGQTGSGKTRVYIERIKYAFDNGQSALLLTPEIALTPQLLKVLNGVFGNNVVVIHSELKKSERRSAWQRVHETTSNGESLVVVGTRSALFYPIANLGLIVVDEMHETSYKQDSSPRYNALRVAAKLAQLSGAEILYGSATPLIHDYFIAQQKKLEIITLHNKAKQNAKTIIRICDKKNSSNFSRSKYLSDEALNSIQSMISNSKQSLLFLNKRGTARQVLCNDCGWHASCSLCDLTLTYHGDTHDLRCHGCGKRYQTNTQCPDCLSTNILYRSIGTKAIEAEVRSFFPEARIARYDTDNGSEESIDKHYKDIHEGNIDIIIGTQLIAKGFDLPRLGLMCIVDADSGLFMPDFSTNEKTYQLLHQAVGRVGRGHTDGLVIVQTRLPESPLIKTLQNQDWANFYESEIKERKAFNFPPFCFLMTILISDTDMNKIEKDVKRLESTLRTHSKTGVNISEPMPCFYEKLYGKHRWQIIVKARQREKLIEIIKSLPKGRWTFDLDPVNLL
jgi:primosomal protein N' (replication factor Y)